jgi:predicted MFS family arabinose efflux permease
MRALRQGFAYVWSTPDMRALMLLAFLVNFAAYPLVGSLLAYIAKDIYGLGQTGLGWLIACFAAGALAGSIAISTHGALIRPARTMLACAVGWFSLNLAFAWIESHFWGEVVLFVAGFVQSFCMIPMSVLLLRGAQPEFRGRVMGVRMLAVYGLPIGLLLSGPLVEHVGFPATGSLYSLVGIVFTLLIAVCWRRHLWHPGAAANLR